MMFGNGIHQILSGTITTLKHFVWVIIRITVRFLFFRRRRRRSSSNIIYCCGSIRSGGDWSGCINHININTGLLMSILTLIVFFLTRGDRDGTPM